MLPGEKEFRALLALITDPQKYAARLDELMGREQAAKDSIERASNIEPQAQEKLAEAHELIRTATQERNELANGRKALAKAEDALRAAEAKFDAERIAKKEELRKREEAVAKRESAVSARESDVSALEARNQQVLSEAEALRGKWQSKLAAFKSIQ